MSSSKTNINFGGGGVEIKTHMVRFILHVLALKYIQRQLTNTNDIHRDVWGLWVIFILNYVLH